MKILIIGCGSIGRRHAQNCLHSAETAVYDPSSSVLEQCSRELDVITFTDFQEGLDWEPNGVIIATPTHTHMTIANQALKAGADLLIEKPISHTTDGVRELLMKADRLGRKIYVVCNMRFHPAVSILRKNLERIGRPLFARAHVGNYLPNMRPQADYRKLYCGHRDQGGGVILDAIHEIDYLMWFFGAVNKVTCASAKLSNLEIDVEDYACICLTHAEKFISEIQMDYLRPYKRRGCEIVGEEGQLLWESEGKSPEHCVTRIYTKEKGDWETLLNTKSLETNRPYEIIIDEFIRAIQGEEVSLLNGWDAFSELKVASKALQSGNS